jgi:sugar/nucleoside kinase (ribokinase family)
MMDIITIGWLTVDDIVLTDGTCRQAVVGGGAIYSAVGAHLFADRIGTHSVCGRPYFERIVRDISSRGIDAGGIHAIEGNGLELWLLHESDVHKQQVPKLSSSSADEMDRDRGPLFGSYRTARGYHIAPQTPAGSLASVEEVCNLGHRPCVTMDILSDAFIDARLYEDLAFLKHLTAFMPSESEIVRIWRPSSLEGWLRDNAVHSGCHVVAKLGEKGSLVSEAGTGRLTQVPALDVDVMDTTGAGDAYCGGFAAGLIAGQPLAVCGAMGTVAASYVVQACGALATSRPELAERNTRLEKALSRVRSWNS